MKEVTKKEFFDKLGDKNVSLRVHGKFPFTTDFVMKSTGKIEGRKVESYTDGVKGNYPIIERFYVPAN